MKWHFCYKYSYNVIRDKMDTFDRGSSFSALQEASLWNRQTRETGPVSWWFKVLDENFQPDQIKCGCAYQEKGIFTIIHFIKNACYHPQTNTLPVFRTFIGFKGLIGFCFSLLCQLNALFCPPTQSSIPLPSRSRKTKRRNVWRGGCWMSCTRYSWTRTLSITAWPTTWQTLCSDREARINPVYLCGNRFGDTHISRVASFFWNVL